jgi:hypothetical protein
VAAALSFSFAGAACSSARGDEAERDTRPGGSGDTVTISGCLSSSADGRFALTAAPDAAVATIARAAADEAETHTYILIGGDNLQSHLGKRVEVTGTLTGKTQELDHDAKTRTEQPKTSSGETPTVKTNEEVEISVRQMTVSQVREVAPTCTVNP